MKCLDTQLNEPTHRNSAKVPKVVNPKCIALGTSVINIDGGVIEIYPFTKDTVAIVAVQKIVPQSTDAAH